MDLIARRVVRFLDDLDYRTVGEFSRSAAGSVEIDDRPIFGGHHGPARSQQQAAGPAGDAAAHLEVRVRNEAGNSLARELGILAFSSPFDPTAVANTVPAVDTATARLRMLRFGFVAILMVSVFLI